MHFVDAKSILSAYNGMNIYRGCTHGCIYCDSRSDCYHTPKPFEDIEVKGTPDDCFAYMNDFPVPEYKKNEPVQQELF